MALWGKTDNLAGKPKFVARKCLFDSTAVNTTAETIDLINANTNFATGDAVYYSINGGTVIGGLTDATVYYVRRVGSGTIELYDTQAHAAAAPATTGRLNISGAGIGTHILQKTLAVANTNDHTYPSKVLVFVDQAEAQKAANKAKGIHGGGWYLYSTYTDAQSNTRHKAELLAELQVLPGVSGDAEDVIAEDLVITIDTQPQSVEITSPDDVTLTVEASVDGDAELTYQWYDASDNSVVEGATSATLELTNVTAPVSYYVVVSASGMAETSNTADITEA